MTIATQHPIALVTGAGQGIGAGIAWHLANAGHHVVVNDLYETRAQEVADMLCSAGHRASPLVANVADRTEIDAMFDSVERDLGPVDVLVNNAGVAGDAGIRNVTPTFWEHVGGINLDGPLWCTRRALGTMRERRSGCVLSIASRAWLGWWGQSAYAAAKAGVIGMTRALAIETASRNIRLNVIAPGLIDTPLLQAEGEDILRRLMASVPLGKPGSPDDIGAAAAFLCSDRAASITGQVLYVCGGKSVYAYPDWPGNG